MIEIKERLRSMVYLVFGWRGYRALNFVKTLYYNFRLFPFGTAIKLPIFIHCGVKTYKMGKIRIEGEVKNGMISIGCIDLKSQGVSKILNRGEIIFKGSVILGGATIIDVEETGTIVFEGETQVGEGCSFFIRKRLEIGKYTRMGFRCFCMDSDDHYMINVLTHEVKANKKEIIIGKCNWIANGTIMKKGARTPDYTIVASANALVAKDYTDLPPYSIIGGMPAKLIASGYRRIYNKEEEERLNIFFGKNSAQSINVDLNETDLETFCTDNAIGF